MGHYDEQYEVMEEASRKRQEERLAYLKMKFPKTPSRWDITLAERVKLLEDKVFGQK
jgi:hypothetical protein